MRIFLAFALLFIAAPFAGGQSCSPKAAEQSAEQLLGVQKTLRATPVGDDEAEIPGRVRPTLHNFKQLLIRTVDLVMRCGSPPPETVQAGLRTLLHAPRLTTRERDQGFAEHLDLTASLVPDHPGLLAVQLSFGILCGEDTILLLYRSGTHGWTRELVWMNPDLNTLSDAFGDFFLWSFVPGPNGVPLVAVVHGTPWCTSRFSGFKVDLLAPAADERRQRLLQHREEGYIRFEIQPRMTATKDGFDLRLQTTSRDPSRITRLGVFRFRTVSGSLERVQPVALNARDFVDAWIDAPWAESAAWTADRSPALHAFRDRFDYDLHKDGGLASLEYGPVLACGGGRFQVELDLSEGEKLDRHSTAYARVRAGDNAFRLLDIARAADAACTGPDLMKQAPRGKKKTSP